MSGSCLMTSLNEIHFDHFECQLWNRFTTCPAMDLLLRRWTYCPYIPWGSIHTVPHGSSTLIVELSMLKSEYAWIHMESYGYISKIIKTLSTYNENTTWPYTYSQLPDGSRWDLVGPHTLAAKQLQARWVIDGTLTFITQDLIGFPDLGKSRSENRIIPGLILGWALLEDLTQKNIRL